MPNIDTYLTAISEATYGSEVRSSIVAAIQECYNEYTEPGLSTSEKNQLKGLLEDNN